MNLIACRPTPPRFRSLEGATRRRGVLYLAGLRRPVWLEGFGEGMARWFQEQWLGSPEGCGDAIPYRIIKTTSGDASPPAVSGFAVQDEVHSVRIVSDAGHVVLVPGGMTATVTPAPGVGDQDHRLCELVGHALHHALLLDGGLLVHAAAFEAGGLGILAVAPGGGGKSTVAAAAVASGGRVVSDDLVVLRRTEAGFVEAVALRRHLHLRDGSASLLGGRSGLFLEERRTDTDNRFRLHREQHPSAFLSKTVIDMAVRLELDGDGPAATFEGTLAAPFVAHLIEAATPLFLSSRFARERDAGMAVINALTASTRVGLLRLGPDMLDHSTAGKSLAAALRTYTSSSPKKERITRWGSPRRKGVTAS